MRILLVEDERHISEALARILEQNNYDVDCVYDGEDGLSYALTGIYDLLILDIMLPKMLGTTVLKEFRKQNKTTPVIILSARGEIPDRVEGLDLGADDYIPKPFNSSELLARVRAAARRKSEIVVEHSSLCFGDISLNMQTLTLSSNTENVSLSAKECKLFEYLIFNPNIVLSKDRIIEKIWSYDSEAVENYVEVYISFLRKKLLYINSGVHILTVRGVGYKLCLRD